MKTTKHASLQQLQTEARRIGCTIEVDDDCQCYRATAPDGLRFEPELHELVSVFGGGIIGNGQTRGLARDDLIERLREYGQLESRSPNGSPANEG